MEPLPLRMYLLYHPVWIVVNHDPEVVFPVCGCQEHHTIP